jgi:hypothetical protein
MKCTYKKEGGGPCNANAMIESDYCYVHNPDISAEEKRDANVRGGSNRAVTLKDPLPEMPIRKMPDVALLLVDTINRVRTGKMDIRVANCLGFLSDKLIKALEISELEERFDKLERLVNEKTPKQ